MKLSIIVPCYNSMPILETMVKETIQEVKQISQIDAMEFVLVNDCSPNPETIGFLKKITDEYDCVKLINMAKNSGQANEQVAALHFVTGDVVLNMDDDMQTHPKNIPLLFNKLMEGYDLVLGKYPHKRHAWYRRVLTKMDDKFEDYFLNKPHDLSFTSYWMTWRYITDEIIKYTAPYSFMEGLFLRTAGHIANVDVEHFERTEGKSGYNLKKLVKLWSNFTGFTIKPLRISGCCGLMMFLISIVWIIVLIVQKANGQLIQGYASLMCVMLLFFGIVLIGMGIIGEYVGRIFMAVNGTPQYVIREVYDPHHLEEKK